MITCKSGSNMSIVTVDLLTTILFSYSTLVGVHFREMYYFQEEGLASSQTTRRHIKKWIGNNPSKRVTKEELERML